MSSQAQETSTLTRDAPAEARIGEIIRRLRDHYPDLYCPLHYETPVQLLVAVILSAQCTDERVNMVTPALFAHYPDAESLAGADREHLEELIHSTGFYRQKARYIQETCQRIVTEYGGEVPASMEELLTLTGVARKTANVVLSELYGIADGIVVDTHVMRLSQRLGLTDEQRAGTPSGREQALMALVPRDEWIGFGLRLIYHGRAVCDARRPDCPNCVLLDLCPSAAV